MKLTICGNNCDVCLAYKKNHASHEDKAALAAAWKKYVNLDFPPERFSCEGGVCCSDGLGLGHEACRYKPCTKRHSVPHCGECPEFPCPEFDDKRQMSEADFRRKLGKDFDLDEYRRFLSVFDNRTWITAYRRRKAAR